MEIIIILGLIIQYWQVSLVVFIAFFVFLVWYGIKHSNDAENRARLINYMKASDKLVISADKTRSIEKVKEKIADLDREYDKTRDFMGYSGNQLHSDYKEGLVERLHELEEEKWERKADRILQEWSLRSHLRCPTATSAIRRAALSPLPVRTPSPTATC